jgi:hypothetical protein
VSNFDISKVTQMLYMFKNCISFTQYVRGWVIEQYTKAISGMFIGATAMISAYTGVTGFNSGNPTFDFFNVGVITSGTEGTNMRDGSNTGQTGEPTQTL